MKGDAEWRDEIRRTGRWDRPRYWKTADYEKASPWSRAELTSAFSALRRIFTPQRTVAMFEEDARLEKLWRERAQKGLKGRVHPKAERLMWRLFVDPWSPALSTFLELGLDAAACEAWTRESFVHGLTNDRTALESTCFEVAVFAALKHARVHCTHEPLKPDGRNQYPKMKAPNPDFEITVGKSRYLLEVKRADEGDRASEEREWLTVLGMGTERTDRIPCDVKLLEPQFAELQERDGGTWMRRNLTMLQELVEDAKIALASSQRFPATAVVEDCIRVTVKGPRSSQVPGGGTMGVRLNSMRESKRILRTLLAKGVTQIPADRPGIVLINPGWAVDSNCLRDEVRLWFESENEGALYPQVLGVAIVARQYSLDYALALSIVVPVWRASAPVELTKSDIWNRLGASLSLHELRRYVFQAGLTRASTRTPRHDDHPTVRTARGTR